MDINYEELSLKKYLIVFNRLKANTTYHNIRPVCL